MIAALRKAGWNGPLELDEEGFRLLRSETSFLNLHNAYADWKRAPFLRRREVVRRYAESLASSPEPPEAVAEARPNLLPRVRDLEWLKVMELELADARDGQGPEVTYAPLNEELAVEIVYDWSTATASLARERFEAWGMSIEEALRTARANLRERTDGTFQELEPGVFTSHWLDAYDASRLLLAELISRLDLDGDPVALVPNRDRLLLTGSDDVAGLGRIAELAEPLLSEQRNITGRAFVWRDGAWAPYLPPEDHPQHGRFQRLVQITRARHYADQKAALEQRQHRTGEDLHVGALLLLRNHGSETLTSWCSWGAGMRALLPLADLVVFGEPGETEGEHRHWRVPWEDAVAHWSASAWSPRGLCPERWLVDAESFPTMGVTDVEAADAAGEVDEGVAVDVGERRAARRGSDDRERHRQRARDDVREALSDLP